jgi:hypothetical protein
MDSSIELRVGKLVGVLEGVSERLDETRDDIRAIREKQSEVQTTLGVMTSDSVTRNELLGRLEQKLSNVEQRVDDLVALRNRFGGAVLILVILSGLLVKFSTVVSGLFEGIGSLFRQ